MSLSLHGERKGPKERPLRESPTVPPLRNPPPDPRDSFAKAKESDCAYSRKDQEARTNGGAPSARNSLLCFNPKNVFSGQGKPRVATKRMATRAVVTLPTVRLYGKLRLYRVSAHLPLANEHADEGIGSLRKVPWVLSLSGALLVLFCRHGQKST